jgi:lycopene beta-cyclase
VKKTDCDYLFAGAGASCALLLLELHHRKALAGKRIILVDPLFENASDKTFCFWAEETHPMVHQLKDLVQHSWSKLALPNQEVVSMGALRYYHISSSALFSKLRNLEQLYGWKRETASVYGFVKSDDQWTVQTSTGSITAQHVFDSRTPSFASPRVGEYHLLQSFVGWVIETPQPSQQVDTFRIMDFEVEQDGFTQFVYVLPFSATQALVELTRFGEEPIPKELAEERLKEYIGRKYAAYTKQHTEQGCIPMSTATIESNGSFMGIALGSRACKVKPSTGYAFRAMFEHAQEVVEALESRSLHELTNKKRPSSRFEFYDALLLHLLKEKPATGKPIFERLFAKVKAPTILRFLDERSTLTEEIGLFSRLPWSPFLWALGHRVKNSALFQPLVLLAFTLIFLLLGSTSAWQEVIAYTMFAIGLMAVGIPHGAVDHLLETGSWQGRKSFAFIGGYVLKMLAMVLLWWWWPALALIIFVCYSAWHFGQADGEEWRLSNPVSMAWGLSVLAYLLGTHAEETTRIIATMGVEVRVQQWPAWVLLPWLVYGLLTRKGALALTALWLMVSSALPLLLAFGLYFIGQHSLTGWGHIKARLQQSHTAIWLKAFPFHVGAWLFFVLFVWLWPVGAGEAYNGFSKWGLFFMFIASISFPHFISMNALYSAKGK